MRTANGWKLGIIAASVSLALGAQAQQAEKDQQRSQSAQQQQQQGSQAQRSQSGQSQQQVRQSSESMTFDKLAEQHSNLTEFANAVKAAGLDDSLADGTEYTIFAPTNQAFDAKQGTSIDELAACAHLEVRDEFLGSILQRLNQRGIFEHVAKRRYAAVAGIENRTAEAPGARDPDGPDRRHAQRVPDAHAFEDQPARIGENDRTKSRAS